MSPSPKPPSGPVPFALLDYNRAAWNGLVERKNRWTVPVSSEAVAAARAGRLEVVLTPKKPVPIRWFPPLAGAEVLCLASGGGQQGPLLAAAGARVTVFDNAPRQLAQDRFVADRDGLEIATVQGDMRDLSAFEADRFDVVFNPVSICFIPDVEPVWREAARVLKPGGLLLMGAIQPSLFVFEDGFGPPAKLSLRHKLPYADTESLSDEEREKLMAEGEPFIFSHSLDALIGGQLRAGLRLTDLYEDAGDEALGAYMPTFVATRSEKPAPRHGGPDQEP